MPARPARWELNYSSLICLARGVNTSFTSCIAGSGLRKIATCFAVAAASKVPIAAGARRNSIRACEKIGIYRRQRNVPFFSGGAPMLPSSNRRQFLQTATGGALLGLTNLQFVSQLPGVSAAEAEVKPEIARLRPEIEPLVRFIEESPPGKLIDETVARINRGLSYQGLLAALFLAGVRYVEPRPSVGFKFHAVLVVNSAHLASLASPERERWLPILWAVDHFKGAQAQNIRERNGWRMPAVNESALPPAHRAKGAFIEAMEKWDPAAADVAVAGLARSAGAAEIFELFCRFAPRDFRSIGHKAIFLANSRRTLDCIGWENAEPILRSLAYALLANEGGDPSRHDSPADRAGRHIRELAGKMRQEWLEGGLDGGTK